MLRESTQIADNQVDLKDVTQGLSDGTQIPNADVLVNFAESIVSRDIARIAAARLAVADTLGNDAMVDAAAVASAFHGFVRIADAIGIPYTTAAQGQDVPEIREAAGINDFYRIQEAG
jgi:hypothetical protein|tara:strand:- start:367 stop:720 length:354 start_codon:yes stop_codon:yes gene_type:complete